METFTSSLYMALWLGVLTSISPCPLATNIAAISFIGKQVGKTSTTLMSGLLYAAGRTLVYLSLGMILVSSTQAVPAVSFFLQEKMQWILGPFLVLVGLFLLDILSLPFKADLIPSSLQKRLAGAGPLGAFGLGAVFALSFCPVSAALFFGSTFGLAVQHESRFLIPTLYGIGTAAPVLAFAFIIAFAAQAVGRAFKRVSAFDKWARRISGIVFVLAGLYLTATVNLRVF